MQMDSHNEVVSPDHYNAYYKAQLYSCSNASSRGFGIIFLICCSFNDCVFFCIVLRSFMFYSFMFLLCIFLLFLCCPRA